MLRLKSLLYDFVKDLKYYTYYLRGKKERECEWGIEDRENKEGRGEEERFRVVKARFV